MLEAVLVKTVAALFAENQVCLFSFMHIVVADRAIVIFFGETLLCLRLRAGSDLLSRGLRIRVTNALVSDGGWRTRGICKDVLELRSKQCSKEG